MHIVKVLEILNNHILKLEEENQFKDWELERLRNERDCLKNGLEEKIKEYEKKI